MSGDRVGGGGGVRDRGTEKYRLTERSRGSRERERERGVGRRAKLTDKQTENRHRRTDRQTDTTQINTGPSISRKAHLHPKVAASRETAQAQPTYTQCGGTHKKCDGVSSVFKYWWDGGGQVRWGGGGRAGEAREGRAGEVDYCKLGEVHFKRGGRGDGLEGVRGRRRGWGHKSGRASHNILDEIGNVNCYQAHTMPNSI